MPRLSREESREQTRDALRRSAAANFARFGYEGASVDQISEDAGFSRGAFYSNFPDQEALFLDLLVRHLEQDVERFRRAADQCETIEALVDRLASAYRDLGDNPDWCFLSSEFQLYTSRPGRSGSAFVEAYASYRQKVAELLQRSLRRLGARSALGPHELTCALIGLSHGLALERAATGSKLPMEVTGTAIRALIFGSLAAPSQKGSER